MSPSLIAEFFRFLTPTRQQWLLIVVVATFFIAGSIWSYTNLYVPYMNSRNNEFVDENSALDKGPVAPDAVLYFFHVDWCPHCVTALPEWEKFVANNTGMKVNGKLVSFMSVNLTKEDSENGVDQALRQKYNVSHFPEVHLVLKNKKPILLDAKPTEATLVQFLNDSVK
jgi:thiol-disulfide isomerase/thioredoxin